MTTFNGNLSKDVLIEILSKLPVKSLLRFKSCCRFLSALVKDHDFISTHIENYNEDNTRLVVSRIMDDSEERGWRDDSVLYLDGTFSDLSQQHLHPQVLELGERIVGCCDGLIFVSSVFVSSIRQIRILNLATREFMSLTIPISQPTDPYIGDVSVGFGLDLTSKDRKLVTVSYTIVPRFLHVAICNLNTNTWKELGDKCLVNYMMLGCSSTYLNGFLYWIMNRDDVKEGVIVSFDLSNEVFKEIDGPYSVSKSEDNERFYAMGSCNDRLSIIVSYYVFEIMNSFELWVMNDGFWTKQSTFLLEAHTDCILGFWKNDGLFFYQWTCVGLLYYDWSTKEVRDLHLEGSHCHIQPFSYKESLIPLGDGSVETIKIGPAACPLENADC